MLNRYTPLLSHGEAIYIACPTRTTVNGWKDFRSFGSNLKDSSYLKPATVSEITDDADAPKKAKTTVPKEFINALKSEVDEMESSSPPTIQRTQQDFANYLAGSTVGHENLPKSSTSTSGAPGAPGSTADAGNVVNNANVKTIGTDPSGAFTVYQYKFSSSDALLSDPKRSLDRRRAIEKKLQEQQAESRATTTKNVQRALGGNLIIAMAKLAVAISSGSSAMLSEFFHSAVDSGNQALLLVGLSTSQHAPDKNHPYGYGKAMYFWALVSALGTFFLGGGVSMTHAVGELMQPSVSTEVAKEVWGVLILSFCVDGYVFGKTVQEMLASRRIDGDGINKEMSFWKYATTKVRDPATLAVLLEDGAACLGVVLAIGGIGLTHYTGNAVFDGIAGVGISGLLLAMGVALAKVNHRFLIGQGLDRATREDIEQMILARRSVDNVFSIQSMWTGPDTFSFKAQLDFDGTFLAAKLLPRYEQEFFDAKNTLDRDLRVLLSWYAEDVMRLVEREVRHIEEEIKMKYPAAQYIELEPMSKDVDRYAIDDGMEAQLRRVEIESLNRYLKSLYKNKENETASAGNTTNN
ncbi:hypothetical protein ACHAXA_002562 [Cyclostephanos tholiformis]|uniref:Cation efflux protein transmembrane domain-containing protein n=1 Tax=Cyclostephanos tholiformis TaxID=382380 RepID=A0ABD3RGC1_9STRA